MTIDEYLNQPRKLKAKSERLYEKMLTAEAKVTAPRDPLNLGDGVRGRSTENTTENKLIEYIDANKAYSEVTRQYIDARNNINNAIDNLLYWQGSLIYQLYIFNAAFDGHDDMKDAGDILRTNDRREILEKLAEAKEAFADLLRAQGVEIEQRTITENGKTTN